MRRRAVGQGAWRIPKHGEQNAGHVAGRQDGRPSGCRGQDHREECHSEGPRCSGDAVACTRRCRAFEEDDHPQPLGCYPSLEMAKLEAADAKQRGSACQIIGMLPDCHLS